MRCKNMVPMDTTYSITQTSELNPALTLSSCMAHDSVKPDLSEWSQAIQARIDMLALLVRFATGAYYDLDDSKVSNFVVQDSEFDVVAEPTDITNIWDLHMAYYEQFQEPVLEHFGVLSFSCDEVCRALGAM